MSRLNKADFNFVASSSTTFSSAIFSRDFLQDKKNKNTEMIIIKIKIKAVTKNINEQNETFE